MSDWLYENKPFTEAPEEAFGFIYLITRRDTQQKYIGKKQFWSDTSKRVDGRKNRRHTIKESNWKRYWSSSEELQEAIAASDESFWIREILSIHNLKGDLTYAEVEEQFRRDVIHALLPNGQREYLNKNILNRFFAKQPKVQANDK